MSTRRARCRADAVDLIAATRAEARALVALLLDRDATRREKQP
jgi:hypothetical protein